MDYHIADVKPTDKCDECGAPASLKLVTDYPNRDDGHVDEICLCDEHSTLTMTLVE